MTGIFPWSVVNVGDPVASGTTPQFQALIVDGYGAGIHPNNLNALTLTIADTVTGFIINGAQQVNILNVGRGTLDVAGNLTITLQTGDTTLSEAPGLSSVQRSLVISWEYNGRVSVGRHQINFNVIALAGDMSGVAETGGVAGPTGPTGATGVIDTFGDLDGGFAGSNYGGVSPIDAGGA